jgi:hypothetical protein
MASLQRNVIRKLKRFGGVPGRLALQGLRYASALPPMGPEIFADRLYRYHTLPRSSLESERADIGRLAVISDWRLHAPNDSPWVHLTRRDQGNPRWKLYLSPMPAAVFECVRRALPILAAHDAVAVKIGREPAALLRPDRCLAYFEDYASLHGASTALVRALSDFPGLGVPFTSPVGDGRLISLGVEPWSSPRPEAVSWRQWVTSELGHALYEHAVSHGRPSDAVAFALRRLEEKGVDLARFMIVLDERTVLSSEGAA